MDGTGNIKISLIAVSTVIYAPSPKKIFTKAAELVSNLLQAAEQTLMQKVTVADYNTMVLVSSAEINKHTNQKNRRGRIQEYLGSPHALQ